MPRIFPPHIKADSHTQIVIGFDENQRLIFMKTFNCRFESEAQAADEATKWCAENCKGGYMQTGIGIFEYIARYAHSISIAE